MENLSKTGKKIDAQTALSRILKRCEESNFNFIGFKNEKNEYENNRTKLILQCSKCKTLKEIDFNSFVNRNGGICTKCQRIRINGESDAIIKIKNVCSVMDYTFLGFNSDDGKYHNARTKIIFKCNKCGKTYNGTSYANFVKPGRLNHKCGSKTNVPKEYKKYNKEIATLNILNKLENSDFEFINFQDDEFKGPLTKVNIRCKKCGEVSQFNYFTLLYSKSKRICKNCKDGLRTKESDVIKIINEKCKYLNYTFLGFNSRDKKYHNIRTNLILRCNKCGKIWEKTKFSTFKKCIIKCPFCKRSHMEKEVEYELNKNGINFIDEKKFTWLKNKSELPLDFYLPDYNIAIECQGAQHYKPIDVMGGEKRYIEQTERDKLKLKLCEEHGVKILYFDSENKTDEFLGKKVFIDKEKLIDYIKKNHEQKNQNVGNPV